MLRRYRRVPGSPSARQNVPLWELPVGEGPSVLLMIGGMSWPRLGPGMGALVGGQRGVAGALAFGLSRDLAVIWAVRAPSDSFSAYLYHATPGPIPSPLHSRALGVLGLDARAARSVYVLLASQREISDAEGEIFLKLGVNRERLLLYSGAIIPQFGVSSRGWAGEAA